MDRAITWTLVQSVSDKTSFLQRVVGTFNSKREAVTDMDARRKPKTAVTRIGHTFVFQPNE